MDAHPHHTDDRDNSKAGRWVFWGFALVAAYFLLTEHRAHLVSVLPYLLLAACPLMHLFHHGGHGHRHSGTREGQAPRNAGPGPDSGAAPLSDDN
jgi:hypothetical protein